MSDKVLNNVSFESSFDINDDYISLVMAYAIPEAVENYGYYRRGRARELITDKTFAFIWNNYPETRSSLVDLSVGIADERSYYRDRDNAALTIEFCKNALLSIYSEIEDNDDIEDNCLKIRLLPLVNKDYDYLTQTCKFALDPEKHRLYTKWREAGLRNSKDPAFYDYMWGKIKREKGSIDIKMEVLDAAFCNEALSDSLLKKIAKSSPKNIKRLATDRFSTEIRNNRHYIQRSKRDGNDASASMYEKIVDKLERKIMLFVDCTDREVVSNLLDCLSKDNLPWLMPAASKHYYLANRLQRMIDTDND